MSSKPDRTRLTHSLALRLGLWHAALAAVGAAVVLVGIYVLLARALDVRERQALEVRAAEYADAFENGGIAALRALLEREQQQPHVRSLMVRVVGPGGEVTFVKVPDDWIASDTQVMVPDRWGDLQARRVKTVRIPRDEQRDLAGEGGEDGLDQRVGAARTTARCSSPRCAARCGWPAPPRCCCPRAPAPGWPGAQ
jgi:HAMP domain-containing protein